MSDFSVTATKTVLETAHEVRWMGLHAGRWLQQRWVINEYEDGMHVSHREEWRDVPGVELP